MKVTYFYRKPIPHFHFSIERLFNTLKEQLSSRVDFEVLEMPLFCEQKGNRYKNLRWSSKHNGSINHVVGDIHYAAIGLKKANTILTIHDVNMMKRRNVLKLIHPYFFDLLIPIMRSKIVTVISEETKKDLVKYLPFVKSKIRVVPNFYDPSYKPFPKLFNSEKPVILQMGTRSNKNLERVIEAIQGINCTLVIVGKHEAHLEKMLHEKQIDYQWKSNLSDAEVLTQYQQVDIVCFVSTVEGFGMPILEAQAIGRVVISSTTSSMPEVARDSALLVNPYSIQEIRDGILKLINDSDFRNTLVNRGFENIKRYELSTISDMYYNLYQEIALGNGSKN